MKKTTKIGGIIALLLAAALVVVVGIGSSWFTNWDVKTWFNNWGKDSPEPEYKSTVAISNEGTELKDGYSYTMPTGFTFLRTKSTSSSTTKYEASGEVVLTATLDNPLINGRYTWELSFADETSEWATGKVAELYVTVEPLTERGEQAKITFVQAFSEQIILTVSVENGGSDTCTIDCLKPLNVVDMQIQGSDFGDGCGVDTQISFGAGTIAGNVTFVGATVQLNEEFATDLKNHLNFDVTLTSFHFDSELLDFGIIDDIYSATLPGDWQYSMFIADFDDYDDVHKEAIYYAWYQAYLSAGSQAYRNVFVEVEYKYSVFGTTVYSAFDSNAAAGKLDGAYYGSDIQPSVTLNKGVIFGGW